MVEPCIYRKLLVVIILYIWSIFLSFFEISWSSNSEILSWYSSCIEFLIYVLWHSLSLWNRTSAYLLDKWLQEGQFCTQFLGNCLCESVFFFLFLFLVLSLDSLCFFFFGHCVIAVHFFALFQVIFCGKDGKTYGRIFIGNVFMWRRSRDYMLIFILKGCCSQFSYFYDPSLSGVGPHLLEVKCNLWLYVVHLHSTWWEVDKHHLLEDSIFHKLLCMDDVGLHQSSQ